MSTKGHENITTKSLICRNYKMSYFHKSQNYPKNKISFKNSSSSKICKYCFKLIQIYNFVFFLTAFLFMFVNFLLTTTSLAMVHERVPDREKYGPLPDVVLDNVEAQDWALNVSEVIIVIVSNLAMSFIIFHKHR